jgi:hypothetical protein
MQALAAGDMCAICQEKMHVPVLLRCKHIFCEDCVSEWYCSLIFYALCLFHHVSVLSQKSSCRIHVLDFCVFFMGQ